MGRNLKRIITLLMVFVISFSVLVVPVSADSSKEPLSFWKYLSLEYAWEGVSGTAKAWWQALTGQSDPKAAYNNYVSGLANPVIDSRGSLLCYPSTFVNTTKVSSIFDIDKTSYSSDTGSIEVVDGFTLHTRYFGSYPYRTYFTFYVQVPKTGCYFLSWPSGCYSSSNGCLHKWGDSSSDGIAGSLSYPSTTDHSAPAQSTHSISMDSSIVYSFQVYLDFDKTADVWHDYSFRMAVVPDTSYFSGTVVGAESSETRAGKFSGDYFYEGDNGQQITADNVTLFNETNNTVTNPATGKTEAVKEWTYDYSDRSYHYTTDTGNKGIVKYGDDNASVTMQDSNGNTVTYNYYYYAGTSSGGDSGGGTETGGTTFKDLLVKFFSAIGDVLSGLINGLLSLFTKVVDALGKLVDIFKAISEKIIDLFGGFTDFLKAVFPFLPDEFFMILNLGALLLVAAAVFRKIFK